MIRSYTSRCNIHNPCAWAWARVLLVAGLIAGLFTGYRHCRQPLSNFRPFPSISLHFSIFFNDFHRFSSISINFHWFSLLFHRFSYVFRRFSLISIDFRRFSSIFIDFHCFFIDFRAGVSEGVKRLKTVKAAFGFPPLEPPKLFRT